MNTRRTKGASRQLFSVDKSVRLDDNIRGKPTDPTTPVATPLAAPASDTAGQAAAREKYEAVVKLVRAICDERRDKFIAKDIRTDVLGAKDIRAEDRDGRRSLVDLIKFTVRQARSVDCQGLYRQLEYPAREDLRPILEEEQRLVLEDEEEDWKPTEASRRTRMCKMLDKKFYRQLREKYAVPADLAKVSLIGLSFEIVEVYLSWCEEDDEEGLGTAAYSGGERGASRSVGWERDGGDGRASESVLRRLDFQNLPQVSSGISKLVFCRSHSGEI
ncbi:hypothetical protein CYMTET_40740 [Cymbomonas tetramitiformis]|uniref:Uncharacterized protein n=1 Tax=Cymbomonas tetramitiformis TaxID=36881 RepID=A0AAE0F2Z2_9CHLO|nr:hypothetical protein CYMTET_40740 [Cymbomonas tetramitiformis]